MASAYTTEDLFAAIEKSDACAVNALLALYQRQTEDEQEDRLTSHRNGIGFSAVDADLLSSFAQQAERNRELKTAGERPAHWSDLSPKQMEILRKKLRRYGRQLGEIAEERAAARQERRAA